jgi:hypothetical protein
MSAWSNTDLYANTKPKFPDLRQVREVYQLNTANSTASGAATITFTYNDGGQNNVANVGVIVGSYAYGSGLTANGTSNFFVGNTRVTSVTGNTVTFNAGTTAVVASGTSIEFDQQIKWQTGVANTYNQDTVLVTATRAANASWGSASHAEGAHTGWVHVVTGTGGRAGRRQVETLVCLANAVAYNVLSGNTSNVGTYYAGL